MHSIASGTRARLNSYVQVMSHSHYCIVVIIFIFISPKKAANTIKIIIK